MYSHSSVHNKGSRGAVRTLTLLLAFILAFQSLMILPVHAQESGESGAPSETQENTDDSDTGTSESSDESGADGSDHDTGSSEDTDEQGENNQSSSQGSDEQSGTEESHEAATEEESDGGSSNSEEGGGTESESQTDTQDSSSDADGSTDSADGAAQEADDEEGSENDGTDGTDGDAEGNEDPSVTLIETGDATAGADSQNDVNTNEVDTDAPADDTSETDESTGNDEDDETHTGDEQDSESDDSSSHSGDTTQNEETGTDTTTDDGSHSDNNSETDSDDATPDSDTTEQSGTGESTGGGSDGNNTNDTDLTNTNSASTSNGAEVETQTGANTATDEAVVIDTGDALSYANVVNLVNTNIVDSEGMMLFFTQLLGQSNVDLRELFSTFTDSGTTTTGCEYGICDGADTELNISNGNDATINNDVVVRATSGENSASGDASLISTGDAYAAANVVNMANTNIIGSNYLVLTFNNFGDMIGDVVLPNSEVLLSLFGARLGGGGADLTVGNDNTASTTNNVNATADTGGNTASSTGESVVSTGDANVTANITNLLNSNILGDSFSLLFRVSGDWNGDVHGLPEGMSWTQTDEGIMLFNDPAGSDSTVPYSGDIENTNTANITNNVDVSAVTGDNFAEGSDFAGIETGDATAAANITNIANTNVLGRNWALLIFNIFGDWTGDITFGRPDLWLGTSASAGNPSEVGSEVEYTFTITNFGDVDAKNVSLESLFKDSHLSFTSAIDELKEKADRMSARWDIGTVKAGETVEVTYTATVDETIPFGETPLPLEATVSTEQTEDNLDDNTDVVTITGYRSSGGDGSGAPESMPAKIDIEKSVSATSTTPGETVSYTIEVENVGGRAYYSMLVDTIYDEDGTVITEQTWDLGTIKTDEVITVTYDVTFSDEVTPGTYENAAEVYAMHESYSLRHATEYKSNTASVDLEVRGPQPEVLGETAPTTTAAAQCDQYITKHMSLSRNSTDPEVVKLQSFLRTFEGHRDLEITGVFDTATDDAVRAFQNKYRDEILDPWGLPHDTGHVYYTTKKKVNEIYCGGEETFPLTQTQKREIALYKNSDVTNNFAANVPEDSGVAEVADDPKQRPEEPEVVEKQSSEPVADNTPRIQEPAPRRSPLREWIQNAYNAVSGFADFDLSLR